MHTVKAGKTFMCLQVFAFTAPYSQRIEKNKESKVPCPWYRPEDGLKFIEAHGLGVRAVGEPQPALLCSQLIAADYFALSASNGT